MDRRRGLGHRLLPAREPRAQAFGLRLDDRFRGLAADAGRGPAGTDPDRRLQRGMIEQVGRFPQLRDRPCSSATPTTSFRRASATAFPPIRTGSSGTTSSPATSPASTRPISLTATPSAPSSATGRMRRSASSPSAAPAWAADLLRRAVGGVPGRPAARPRAADGRGDRAADRPRIAGR